MEHPPSLRLRLTAAVTRALGEAVAAVAPGQALPEIAVQLTPPKQAAHGDLTTPAALAFGRLLGVPPRALATAAAAALGDADGLLAGVAVAGPGHLNLTVAPAAWHAALAEIVAGGAGWLRHRGAPRGRVLVEYVSANPTGPLHVAHARGAVTGDVLAALFSYAGWEVTREYYVNDMGNQIDVLAESIWFRYTALVGKPQPQPENFYPGEYVGEIAESLRAAHAAALLDRPRAEAVAVCRELGATQMLARIRADLDALGVAFDHFVSERELMAGTRLPDMLARLEAGGHLYTEGGRRWFRTTAHGDDKDRVVIREDGRPTYFASDIAYHHDKMQRGFDRLVNVWGADHDGYVARVRAGLTALGHAPSVMDVILIQMVSLSRGGAAVRMGKRLGTAVWLRDVVAEVGRDACRYFFLMRRSDAQMDFDLDLAQQKTLDNPVYYAQMGHARLSGIVRRATAEGVPTPTLGPGALDALVLPEELALIATLTRAPEIIAGAAEALAPHHVVFYIQELIAQFHSYYSRYKATHRVVSDDPAATRARLLLCRGIATVLAGLLGILGVDAPEQM